MAITREAFDKIAGDGKIASADFIKKDGSLRKMVFRTKVTKGVTGEGMRYNPSDYGLRTVYDMQKLAFRHINLNTIQTITAHGKVYVTSTNIPDSYREQFVHKATTYNIHHVI